MGWAIVRHSIILLFRNFGNALKVSIGPYVIGIGLMILVAVALGLNLQTITIAVRNPQAAGQVLGSLGGSVAMFVIAAWAVILFVSAWVAVSWHRFVLLEEYPGLLPGLSGRPILPYVGRTLLLVLVLILIAIPLSMVFGLVFVGLAQGGGAQAAGLGGLVVGLLMTAVLSWIWMRLALVLPATSVGQPIGMGDSWRLTAPVSGAIFLAVLILFGISFAADLLIRSLFASAWVAELASLAVSWASLMVGVSILTTLYGHLVERRGID
jgi:hypothetical protein